MTMYNSKFILKNGMEVYPGYLTKEKRTELLSTYGEQRQFMRCGCKPSDSLFYRISEDLKIYPEHKNYIHDVNCSRYKIENGKSDSNTAYHISDEDGAVSTVLSFNPKLFNPAELTEKEESFKDIEQTEELSENEAIVEKDLLPEKVQKSDPKLSLEDLLRCINLDTYSEHTINKGSIPTIQQFSKLVYFRSKRIFFPKSKRALGELTLENDGVRFVYFPILRCEMKDVNGTVKSYIFQKSNKEGEEYRYLVFPNTLEKAIKKYIKTYGSEPGTETMLGGFQYIKQTRSGVKYRVLGRIHFFRSSSIGLYCRSLSEENTFNVIHQINDERVSLLIPPEDPSIGGIITIKDKKKKILILFRTGVDERIEFDANEYVPMILGSDSEITEEDIYKLIGEMDNQ